jgi:hypothetical protein
MATNEVRLVCSVLNFEDAQEKWKSARVKCKHHKSNVNYVFMRLAHCCTFYNTGGAAAPSSYRACVMTDCPIVIEYKRKAAIQKASIKADLVAYQKGAKNGNKTRNIR